MRYIILLILSTYTLNNYAQRIVIANNRQNIVYAGIENPLSFLVEGYPCGSIYLSTDNGQIERYDSCYCSYRPTNTGISKIIVSGRINDKKVNIGEYFFRVMSPPLPIARIAGKNGGSIKKEVLKVQGGVIARVEGFDIMAHILVKSYTVIILRNNEQIFFHSNKGNRYNQEVIDAFSALQPSDDVFIIKITVETPDGKQHSIQGLEFTVIE